MCALGGDLLLLRGFGWRDAQEGAGLLSRAPGESGLEVLWPAAFGSPGPRCPAFLCTLELAEGDAAAGKYWTREDEERKKSACLSARRAAVGGLCRLHLCASSPQPLLTDLSGMHPGNQPADALGAGAGLDPGWPCSLVRSVSPLAAKDRGALSVAGILGHSRTLLGTGVLGEVPLCIAFRKLSLVGLKKKKVLKLPLVPFLANFL